MSLSSRIPSGFSSKKRNIENVLVEKEVGGPPSVSSFGMEITSSSKRLRGGSVSVQSEIMTKHNIMLSNLQNELDHERSLRSLDRKKFQQLQNKLEKQIEFANDEIEYNKQLLEEQRLSSENHIQSLRNARDDAQHQCIEYQQQLQDVRNDHDDGYSDEYDSDGHYGKKHSKQKLWQRKYLMLEEELSARKQHEEVLNQQLLELRSSLEDQNKNRRLSEEPTTPSKVQQGPQQEGGSMSPAPKAMMKELNRIRIELADCKRENRQIKRQNENYQGKMNSWLQEREKNKSAALRVQSLEYEIKKLNQSHGQLEMENQQWRVFHDKLSKQLKLTSDQSENNQQEELQKDEGDERSNDLIPPELTKLLRHMETSNNQIKELTKTNSTLQNRIDTLKKSVAPTEEKIKAIQTDNDNQQQALIKKQKEDEKQLSNMIKQVETLKAKEGIWKREIEGLKSIITTMDDADKTLNKGSADTSNTQRRMYEVKCKSLSEELKICQDNFDSTQKELKESQNGNEEKQKEIDRIKEKFIKLRDALYAEKNKASEAEARANRAEELAGQGHYNPETTKVIHMTKNPLTDALKNEINVLKKQIEIVNANQQQNQGGAQSAEGSATTAAAPTADPDKLHLRLKESFKEQISMFREGVYLMTGYKIDMIPGKTVDCPRFRVRSMFAEQQEDHLMLQWPKTKLNEEVTSLDLLNTEFGKHVTMTPSFEYMTKFHSLPAFLSSVQLMLFEKQTLMC